MGPITKIVGGAIGLTKEYQANRREQRVTLHFSPPTYDKYTGH
jgi:hypothetical protein